jgi:hypothetical protein
MVNRIDDRSRPFRTGGHITRRYPASDSGALKPCTSGVGHRFILMRIADEYVEIH